MTLELSEDCKISLPFDYRTTAEDVIRAVLEHEDFPYEAEVSLTLADEASIRDINREFRHIDRVTDVLSFPMLEYPCAGDFSQLTDEADIFDPDTGEVMLGDIVLCIPRVITQASDYGHSVRREYAFLIAHSMLHLLGYDHIEEADRLEMETLQDEILDGLGITRDVS